jgi:hypothetical protein
MSKGSLLLIFTSLHRIKFQSIESMSITDDDKAMMLHLNMKKLFHDLA